MVNMSVSFQEGQIVNQVSHHLAPIPQEVIHPIQAHLEITVTAEERKRRKSAEKLELDCLGL